jgi:hypothetical protein
MKLKIFCGVLWAKEVENDAYRHTFTYLSPGI